MITSDATLPFVSVLSLSLEKVQTLFPFVVLITSSVSSSSVLLLKRLNCIVIQIDLLPSPSTFHPANARWHNALSKLHIWNLTQYDRVVWLDADTMVLGNLDELFYMPASFIGGVNLHTCHLSSAHLCSMLLVIQPRKDIFTSLINFLTESESPFPGGDQDLIEMYFSMKTKIVLLNESWSSFVYRCMCDDYPLNGSTTRIFSLAHSNMTKMKLPQQFPRLIHFTGHFLPLHAKGTLASKAEICALPFYRFWYSLHHNLCTSNNIRIPSLNRTALCPSLHSLRRDITCLFPTTNPKLVKVH
jgi:hypothetical protein